MVIYKDLVRQRTAIFIDRDNVSGTISLISLYTGALQGISWIDLTCPQESFYFVMTSTLVICVLLKSSSTNFINIA